MNTNIPQTHGETLQQLDNADIEIATLKKQLICEREKHQAKSQAAKLAEELRKLIEITPYSGTISAREALTAYESEVQR